jgi:predicted ribosomally synthesized peptide with SipW-like signal peptide
MTRDSHTHTRDHTVGRRSVLAGLGTIGVAAAGAGLGTTAYLSDAERVGGNAVTAGEFDLQVDWQVTYDGPDGLVHVGASPDEFVNDPEEPTRLLESTDILNAGSFVEGSDGIRDPIFTREEIAGRAGFGTDLDALTDGDRAAVETRFRDQFVDRPVEPDPASVVLDPETFADLKPGDRITLDVSLHLFDNPGYLWLTGALVDADEGVITEPEAGDPDEDQRRDGTRKAGDGAAPVVELLDALRVTAWYESTGDATRDPDERVILGGNDDPAADPSLREFLALVATGDGVPLDGDPSTDYGEVVGGAPAPGGDPAREPFENSTTRYLGLAFVLPVDHANEIQGDSVAFDVGVYSEQARHNAGGAPGPAPGLSISNVRASESPNPGPIGLAFDLRNGLSEPVALTELTVAPADPGIVALSDALADTTSPAGYEVYVDASTPGYTDVAGGVALPGSVTLGSDGYADGADREPVLAPGETAPVTLFSFRDAAGEGVAMNGRSVTLTIASRGTTTGRTGTTTRSVTG